MTPLAEKRKAFLINLAYYGVILAIFYLIFKTFAGVLMPFIIALILAALLHKPVKFIETKTPLKRNIPSIILVFLVFGIVAAILFFAGWAAFDKLKEFYEFIISKIQNTSSTAQQIRDWVMGIITKLPDSFEDRIAPPVRDFFDDIIKNGFKNIDLSSITSRIPSILSSGGSAIKDKVVQIPSLLVSLVVTVIASVFLTIDYDVIRNFIFRQFSDERQKKLTDATNLAKTTLSKMVKAYSLIMLITFTEVCIGLFILKWSGIFKILAGYIFIIGILTAIVDIIPVLGTGTVLIPWAVICLIKGDIKMAIGLICMYIIIFVIRQYLEPKLVAGQVGLPPIVTITAMYIGTKTLGVLGFFILPFVVILIKEFNQKGILHFLKFAPEEPENEENGGEGDKEAQPLPENSPDETAENTPQTVAQTAEN